MVDIEPVGDGGYRARLQSLVFSAGGFFRARACARACAHPCVRVVDLRRGLLVCSFRPHGRQRAVRTREGLMAMIDHWPIVRSCVQTRVQTRSISANRRRQCLLRGYGRAGTQNNHVDGSFATVRSAWLTRVCTHACTHVCMPVCTHVCTHVDTHVCTHGYVHMYR